MYPLRSPFLKMVLIVVTSEATTSHEAPLQKPHKQKISGVDQEGFAFFFENDKR